LVHERQGWLRTLCSRIDGPQPLRRLDLFDGRRRIAFYVGRVPTAVPVVGVSDDLCSIWQFAHQDER